MKVFTYITLVFGVLGCVLNASNSEKVSVLQKEEIKIRLDGIAKKAVVDFAEISYDSLKIPRSVKPNGLLKTTNSSSWTSGFYPGILWQLYGYSKDEELKNAAILWQKSVEKEKWDAGTHDLGFKIYCSFGQAFKASLDTRYESVFIKAAQTLSMRYNQQVEAIRSWDHHEDLWQYPVIIDNMMNLEMLFEVTKSTGDSSFYHIAKQHAFTTLKNHFRADNSSYHVVDYDSNSGAVIQKNTHQGHEHESAWSRGQAWGLYGFVTAYRYTREPLFLKQAQDIAGFMFNHPNLPPDFIPYWDYDAPNIPNEPRDVSAAVIAASGLIELSRYTTHENHYLEWVDQILASLGTEKYQTKIAPFILKHSVGSVPGDFEVDSPIIYADYYYVEALLRRLEIWD